MLNLASALALLVVGANLDVDGAIVAEGRAGGAPLAARDSAPGGFGILTPRLELRSSGHELVGLLTYSARIYEAKIDGVQVQKPLVLQTATLSLNLREGPRFDATAHATGSYGQADFAYLPTVFGPAQATLPAAPTFLALSADLVTIGRLTRLWTLQAALDAVDRRPIGSITPAPTTPGDRPPFVFPHQRSIFFLPSLTGRLTRRDDVIFAAGASYQTTDGALNPAGTTTNNGLLGLVQILTVTESLGWRARLSRGYDFHLAAGVAYNRSIDPPMGLPPISPIAPTGAIDLTVHLVSRREITLRGQFGAVVDYFVDPILATSGPRATTFAHMLAFLPLNWTVGLDAIFSTRLTNTQPPGAAQNALDPDETALTVVVPVRHLISRNLALETGARAGTRAPNLGSSQFGFHGGEAWVYVMLMATSHTMPDYRPD